MNAFRFSMLPLLALVALLLPGCLQDRCERSITYVEMTPIYMSMEDIRAGVGTEAARELNEPGNLYFKDNFVFISEINEGVHVIDNADPANPQPLSFIRVPGVRDMAIRGNMLFVDSYLDLVAIDITNPNAVFEAGREENVFPYGSWHRGLWADEALGIAVDFDQREITEDIDCEANTGWNWGRNVFFAQEDLATVQNVDPSAQSINTITNGIGGSMARFTLVEDFLYAVTSTDLISFSVTNLADPQQLSSQNIGWGDIETIFPMQGHLFIGSMNGMYIYSLSNPSEPIYTSEFQHMRSCDPVVVENDIAFVTLRDGATCNATGVNQLDVIDVANVNNPRLITSYPMDNPHGLGIKDGILFLCEGEGGLKVFDATNVNRIDRELITHFKDIDAFDVIPLEDVLLLIGADGFYQYDYSDLDNIKQLSHLPVIVQ